MIKDQEKIMVQYDKVRDFSGLNEYTFQLVLYRNGVIFFFHSTMKSEMVKSRTIRCNHRYPKRTKDIGLLVAYNSAQIQSEMSVRGSPLLQNGYMYPSSASGTGNARAN